MKFTNINTATISSYSASFAIYRVSNGLLLSMPLFNTPHRIKTYGKTRNKDLCATTAFDKLLYDDESSHVLITHSQSLIDQHANANRESNIWQSDTEDTRTELIEDISSFTHDEDRSSKCKRRRDTTSQGTTKTIGHVKSVQRSSQKQKNKCFRKPSSSVEKRSTANDNSKVSEKHQELHNATPIHDEHLIPEDCHKRRRNEKSYYISSLHQQRQVSSGADDDLKTSMEQHRLQKVSETVSDFTVSGTDSSLSKERDEDDQQFVALQEMSSEKRILRKRKIHPIRTQESRKHPSVPILQFSADATTICLDKIEDQRLKLDITKKDKRQDRTCNSQSFADSDKNNTLISLTLNILQATDDKPQEGTMICQHVNNDLDNIPITTKDCNDPSYKKTKSPQENKLQAKNFIEKLSKLLAGKKSLSNKEDMPGAVPATCRTSVTSVRSSIHEVASQQSMSMHDMSQRLENIASRQNKSPCSAEFPVSADNVGRDMDSCQVLPTDASLHSNYLTPQFPLSSTLQEHNYFHYLERDEKMTDDHSYSLLSSTKKFTIPKSPVDCPMHFSNTLSQTSGDSITAVGTQPLTTHLRKGNNESYEEKTHQVHSLKASEVEECCSVLLKSPLQENPPQSSSPNVKHSENIRNNTNVRHSLGSDSSCKTTQEVSPRCKSRRLSEKVILKQESLKKLTKEIDVNNSVALEEFRHKSCEPSSENYVTESLESCDSALTRGNNDSIQSQPMLMDMVEQTFTECQRNQTHLNDEIVTSSFPMQNSRKTAKQPFPHSRQTDGANQHNSENKDSIQIGNTVSKICATQRQSAANNSNDICKKNLKRTPKRRNSSDSEIDITEDTDLPKKLKASTPRIHRRTRVRLEHRTTEQHSNRTDHHIRSGNCSVLKLRKRVRSSATTDSTKQLLSHGSPGNVFKLQGHSVSDKGLSGAADVLSKRTCHSNHLLKKPHSQQKPQENISIIQHSERRLLKSPLKESSKTKAVYNPRQWLHPTKDEGLTDCTKGQLAKAASAAECYQFPAPPRDDSCPVLSRVSSCPKRLEGNDVIKVQVSEDQKQLFTVVRNVKEAHECQEYGEKQEFQDDVDYILDGLQSSQPLPTRCLSTLSLASKCMVPAFRMHLRAHGILSKILNALHNAPDFMSLSLCLSALLFTMSRDRLAIELDDFSVQLILRLLDVDSGDNGIVKDEGTSAADELERIRLKVFNICTATIQSSTMSHIRLRLSDVTTGFLGLELLLSLTSRHTADWFKETLRSHGGLKHIINSACHCIDELVTLCPDEALSAHFHLYIRSEQCLKVLDNVTYMCKENQSFLLEYGSSMLIEALNSLLHVCIRDLSNEGRIASVEDQSCNRERKVNKESPQFLVSTCFLTLLRLLLNITHESERGCFVIGRQKNFVSSLLSSLLSTSDTDCNVHQFDLSILGLSLLMNLVENCDANRKRLIRLKIPRIPNNTDSEDEEISALTSLALLFSQSFKAARVIEEDHDAKIEAAEEKQQKLKAGNSDLILGSAYHLLSSAEDIDQSGQWVESESGLQWVAKEEEKEEEEGELCPGRLKVSPNDLHSQEAAPSSSQDDTDNYTRDLHTAGKHMEDSFVAAYTAVLIGSIIQHDMHLAETVRQSLPEFSFTPLVRMIRKFLGFMNFTNLTSASGSKTFHDVLKVLESCQRNPVTSD